jgi:hypothetical protein
LQLGQKIGADIARANQSAFNFFRHFLSLLPADENSSRLSLSHFAFGLA